jgi:hypothetical protein
VSFVRFLGAPLQFAIVIHGNAPARQFSHIHAKARYYCGAPLRKLKLHRLVSKWKRKPLATKVDSKVVPEVKVLRGQT